MIERVPSSSCSSSTRGFLLVLKEATLNSGIIFKSWICGCHCNSFSSYMDKACINWPKTWTNKGDDHLLWQPVNYCNCIESIISQPHKTYWDAAPLCQKAHHQQKYPNDILQHGGAARWHLTKPLSVEKFVFCQDKLGVKDINIMGEFKDNADSGKSLVRSRLGNY